MMHALMTLLAVPSFAEPGRLWFLLLVPLLGILYLVLLAWRMDRTPKTMRIMKDRSWLRHTAVVLALLSLASLTVAWAKPRQEVDVPRDRATVIVVMDVSLSMEADDVKPTRLDAAKEAAKEFVVSLPPRFNVSIVEFAGNASIRVPPTTDRGVATAGIDSLRLRESTAIGEGIYTGLDSLLMVPPDPRDPNGQTPAAMVVLSDGESQRGRSPFLAAAEAKRRGVTVNTIAYGTPTGYIIDKRNGRKERVAVDVDHLREIANEGGGKAYYAPSAAKLKEVYAELRQSVGMEKAYQETTHRFVGYGLVLAVLASLGMVSLSARWP